MQRFRERFRAAPQNRDYFAFLKATDGLLHAQGPARLNVALESLDKILREIQSYCGAETEIVMFSDHGMNLEENRRDLTRLAVQPGAADAGNALSSRRLVFAVTPLFIVRTKNSIPEMARASVEITGVDFVVYQDGSMRVVERPRGHARIESPQRRVIAM